MVIHKQLMKRGIKFSVYAFDKNVSLKPQTFFSLIIKVKYLEIKILFLKTS